MTGAALAKDAAPLPDRLTAAISRDQKIVRRWSLPGDPRGVAVGADGTIYVGLAGPQAVAAIDPKTGEVRRQVVLDSAEIASTKELLTLRINAAGDRLYIANGSDESASILALPDLAIVREITIEGEAIRDVVPDPAGRYIYLLGRRVHVFDGKGETELHALPFEDPAAIAAGSRLLAIIGTHDFGNAKATAVALYDTTTFREMDRDPLETSEKVEAAVMAGDESSIAAVTSGHLLEKPVARASRTMTKTDSGQMRMTAAFGDFVNSSSICLPEGAGPQILAVSGRSQVVYAERRCSTGASFIGSARRLTALSLYGVPAYALAFDASTRNIVAVDRSGFLTIYKEPVDPKADSKKPK